MYLHLHKVAARLAKRWIKNQRLFFKSNQENWSIFILFLIFQIEPFFSTFHFVSLLSIFCPFHLWSLAIDAHKNTPSFWSFVNVYISCLYALSSLKNASWQWALIHGLVAWVKIHNINLWNTTPYGFKVHFKTIFHLF